MKHPVKSDFDTAVTETGVTVTFKPTNSIYSFYRLGDTDEIARLGPVWPTDVRHAGPTASVSRLSRGISRPVGDLMTPVSAGPLFSKNGRCKRGQVLPHAKYFSPFRRMAGLNPSNSKTRRSPLSGPFHLGTSLAPAQYRHRSSGRSCASGQTARKLLYGPAVRRLDEAQAHQSRKFSIDPSLEIELPQVCAIVGPNNAGKSNILEAMRRVLASDWGPRASSFSEDDVYLRDAELDIIIECSFEPPIE
jgi:hypothetical protein